jgi:hypothetical protein
MKLTSSSKQTSGDGTVGGTAGRAIVLMNLRPEEHNNKKNHYSSKNTTATGHDSTCIPIGHVQSIVSSFGSNVDLYCDVFHIEKERFTEQQLRIAYFKRGREIIAERNRVQSQTAKKFAKQKFQALTLSFEVLSKSEWKRMYDTYGFSGYGLKKENTPSSFKDSIVRYSTAADVTSRDDINIDNTSRADQSSVGELMSIQSFGSFGSGPILRRSSSWGAERQHRTRQGTRLRWNENVEELVFKKDPEELRYLKWLQKEYEDSNNNQKDDDDDDDDDCDDIDDNDDYHHHVPTYNKHDRDTTITTSTVSSPIEVPPQRFVKIKSKRSKSAQSTSSISSSALSASSSTSTKLSDAEIELLEKELKELDKHFDMKTQKSFANDILDEIENGLHGLKKRIGTFIKSTSKANTSESRNDVHGSEMETSTNSSHVQRTTTDDLSEQDQKLQILLTRSSDAATYVPDNSILTVDEINHMTQQQKRYKSIQSASCDSSNTTTRNIVTPDSNSIGKSNISASSSFSTIYSKLSPIPNSSDNSYDKNIEDAAKELDGVVVQALFKGMLRKPSFMNITRKSIDKSTAKLSSKLHKSRGNNESKHEEENIKNKIEVFNEIGEPAVTSRLISNGGVLAETSKGKKGAMETSRIKENRIIDPIRREQKENNLAGLPVVIKAKIKKKHLSTDSSAKKVVATTTAAEGIENYSNHDDGDSISALTPGTARFGRQQSAASRISGRETILDDFDENDYDIDDFNAEEDNHVVYAWKGEKSSNNNNKSKSNEFCNMDELSVATEQIEQSMNDPGIAFCQGFARRFITSDVKESKAFSGSKRSSNIQLETSTSPNKDDKNEFVSAVNSYVTSMFADVSRIGNSININLEEARKTVEETMGLSEDEVSNMLNILGHEMVPPKGSGGEFACDNKCKNSKRSSPSRHDVEQSFTF